jgi:hypothetical protein
MIENAFKMPFDKIKRRKENGDSYNDYFDCF